MDEYERLEEDLQKLYDDYLLKFRNQAYLEHLLEEQNRLDQDKFEVRICVFLFCCKWWITIAVLPVGRNVTSHPKKWQRANFFCITLPYKKDTILYMSISMNSNIN